MILKFVKIHLKFLGLLNPQDYFRNCLVFISLSIFTVPTFCFFLYEAVTFADYVNSFFFTSCGLLGISFNAVLLWEKVNVNQLIIDLDNIFQKRRTFLLYIFYKILIMNKKKVFTHLLRKTYFIFLKHFFQVQKIR